MSIDIVMFRMILYTIFCRIRIIVNMCIWVHTHINVLKYYNLFKPASIFHQPSVVQYLVYTHTHPRTHSTHNCSYPPTPVSPHIPKHSRFVSFLFPAHTRTIFFSGLAVSTVSIGNCFHRSKKKKKL